MLSFVKSTLKFLTDTCTKLKCAADYEKNYQGSAMVIFRVIDCGYLHRRWHEAQRIVETV